MCVIKQKLRYGVKMVDPIALIICTWGFSTCWIHFGTIFCSLTAPGIQALTLAYLMCICLSFKESGILYTWAAISINGMMIERCRRKCITTTPNRPLKLALGNVYLQVIFIYICIIYYLFFL